MMAGFRPSTVEGSRMNDATSRGGLRGSSPGQWSAAGTWVPHCGTSTVTGPSPELWGWPRRWPGFSLRVAIRTMLAGESCVRLSSIRPLTRRGRGARGARYRWYRRISSGLPASVGGRRWHAPNISPLSAAPSRSPFTLIKPQYSRTWGWSALQGLPNAGALR
jgi:hypothetical protein